MTHRRAFTLLELIIAIVMIAILVASTTTAISAAIRARDRGGARAEASSRARVAASVIAAERASTLRASDLTEARIAILRSGPAGRGQDGILLFAHIRSPIRSLSPQPEGDECESQFRLEPSLAHAGLFTLWNRRQPVPDDYPEAGGVASPLVDGLTSLRFEAFNGASWLDTWDSDTDGFPHAVRLTLQAADDTGKTIITARRVVAFDRVPIPPASDTTTSGSTSTTSASTR